MFGWTATARPVELSHNAGVAEGRGGGGDFQLLWGQYLSRPMYIADSACTEKYICPGEDEKAQYEDE